MSEKVKCADCKHFRRYSYGYYECALSGRRISKSDTCSKAQKKVSEE